MILFSLSISTFAFSAVPLKSISLADSSVTLKVGETYALNAKLSPANTTEKILKYGTTNKNVASVTADGVVAAQGEGTATITVASSNKDVAAVKLTVTVQGKLDEVKLYGYLLGAALPGFPDVMTELNKKLQKDLNCTMEINYIGWGDLAAKYPLILAAGENVDWIYTAAWCQMATQSAKGGFMEMTPEKYAKYMPRHYAQIKNTTALKEVAINGKTYMIPTSTPDKKCDVTLYRQDLVEKYKLPAIKKFTDLEALAAAVKKNIPSMTPVALDNNYDIGCVQGRYFTQYNELTIDVTAFVGSAQGIVYKPFDKDGKLYINSSDPALLKANTAAAKFAKSWYDKGYINRNALSNKVRSKEALVQGKSAIAFGNSIDVQGNISAAEAAGMKIGILANLDSKGRATANAYTNNGVAVYAKTKNWERTLMALDLIMEEPSYVYQVYYGIEGKNYVVKDGKIADPEGVTSANNTYPLDQAGFWFVNKDLFKPQASWTPTYVDLQNNLKKYLAPDTLATFVANTDTLKTELANCTQVMNQYNLPIGCGAVKDVATAYKTLDAKLKAAGADKVKAELQKQINAYLASQK
jgi:putative aldouronate transport system substrate-binding protein